MIKEFFCGYVSIVGEPNAGKSTLLNNLVGLDISIVTHKAQTTRKNVKGVIVHDNYQIIFVDTPGVFRPSNKLDNIFVNQVWKGIDDSDIISLIIDGNKGLTENLETLLKKFKKINNKKIILLINKIDISGNKKILDISKTLNNVFEFDKTFMISAKKKYGLNDFKLWVMSNLPKGPWLFPSDQVSDISNRKILTEITRKKIFELVHEELPYQIYVKHEKWSEFKNGTVKVEQLVIVANKRHKAVLLGKGGRNIKSISMLSRREIKDFLGKEVHLFLRVKVIDNWYKKYDKISLNNDDI